MVDEQNRWESVSARVDNIFLPLKYQMRNCMNFETGDAAPVDASAEAAPEQQTNAPEVDAAPPEEPAAAPDPAAVEEPFFDAAYELELKAIYAQSDPEQSTAELREEFGPQYDSYMRLASGFAQIDGFAEAQHVLEVAGVANHPSIMRFLMNAGRIHYRSVAEDGEHRAPQISEAFEEALDTIRERQREARNKGSSRKADELYRQEMALIARQQGAGSIVNGRRTA
jgi:hypothetical protein